MSPRTDFYFAFLATYVSGILISIVWMSKLTFTTRSGAGSKHANKVREEHMKPLYFKAFGSYVVLGFGAWLTDMLLCDKILSSYKFLQLFLHPVWHLGASIGTHCAILLVGTARCAALGLDLRYEWFMGIPFVKGKPKKKAS